MLVILLLFFGAIAAIIWRSWVVGGIVLALVLVGSFFGLYATRATLVPPTGRNMVIVEEESRPATAAVEPQEPSPEQLQTADVFPSLDDAATNLARKLCGEVCDGALGKKPITHIQIITTDKDGIGATIRSVFRQSIPTAEMVVTDEHVIDPRALVITAKLEPVARNKKLTLTASFDGQNKDASARVEEKLWVNHPDQYQSQYNQRMWMTVWSPMMPTSREGARQQARQEAARKLLSIARTRLPELRTPNGINDALVRERVERDLQTRFIKEEFSQKLNLQFSGSVYRVGLLLDISPDQFDTLQSSVARHVRDREMQTRRFGLGTMGLGVVICVVYLFLNWATRGYFQMNLRLGAFLVLIAGMLLILMIG